jgi:hypothetical protein
MGEQSGRAGALARVVAGHSYANARAYVGGNASPMRSDLRLKGCYLVARTFVLPSLAVRYTNLSLI